MSLEAAELLGTCRRIGAGDVMLALPDRLQDELFSDLLIQTKDGRQKRVHRMVVAASSGLLYDALATVDHQSVECVVYLPDFDFQAVESLLVCLYGGFTSSLYDAPDEELMRCLRIKVPRPEAEAGPASTWRSSQLSAPAPALATRRTAYVIKKAGSAKKIHWRKGPEAVHHKDKCPEDRTLPSGAARRSVFQCPRCERSFLCKSTLYYHLKKHAVPSYSCEQCGRTFKSQRGLKYHAILHSGFTNFLCDDCGRGFVTKQKLLNHRRSKHTFERPYICEQCGRGFIRSDQLVVHTRRAHTGEKPYQCGQCEWRGVDSSSLIHHRKKHSAATTPACQAPT